MQVWVVERSIEYQGEELVAVYSDELLAQARVSYEEKRASRFGESYDYYPSEILTEFKATL